MSPVIDVDVEDYEAASRVFGVDMANGLDAAWNRLTSALSSTAGMAGSDTVGSSWARHYDPIAGDVTGVVSDLRRSCVQLAALLQQTGFNHGLAESASDPSRAVPTPPDRRHYVVPDSAAGRCIPGHDVPLAAGGSVSPPAGWSIVAHAVHFFWPNGDPRRLRDAASAWSVAAGSLDSVGECVPNAVDVIELQRSPEVDDAAAVCLSMQAHIDRTASACRALARGCDQLAGHIDHAHTAIENELTSLLEWTAGIEVAGAVFSVFTAGASEGAAQLAEAGRIAATAKRIAGFIRTLIDAAKTVAETVKGALESITGVASRLRIILGARISATVTNVVDRLPFVTRTAEEELKADATSTSVANEATALSKIGNPKEFDPGSLKGLTPDEVRARIPENWVERPSRSGGGKVYRDPANRGRQIRVMPGYGRGVRPDPLTEGPYAVVSQNGVDVKIPLVGNAELP